MIISCPVCGFKSRIYTSKQVNSNVRQLYFICSANECQAQFKATMETTHIIEDSMLPEDSPKRIHRGSELTRILGVNRPGRNKSGNSFRQKFIRQTSQEASESE